MKVPEKALHRWRYQALDGRMGGFHDGRETARRIRARGGWVKRLLWDRVRRIPFGEREG